MPGKSNTNSFDMVHTKQRKRVDSKERIERMFKKKAEKKALKMKKYGV